MHARVLCFFLLAVIVVSAGCANITAPTGGKKDTIPPKLISIKPADSLFNLRPKRIDMGFDEYITVSDVASEVHISPLLSIDPTVNGMNKKVVVKIVDSLLEENTTYRISFGKAIKDLHEGNPFAGYSYTFSTGSYFDSLQLSGTVISAATGMADTGGVSVILYSAAEKDSAVVKHKPKYITKASATGAFVFKGLPDRVFRIYALKDVNNNLIYDGPAGGEQIAFIEKTVRPGDTSLAPIALRLFKEVDDTAGKKTDSVNTRKGLAGSKNKQAGSDKLNYTVSLDTSNASKRTFDITQRSINVSFNRTPVLNTDKVSITYDSSGITLTPPISVSIDTMHPPVMHILVGNWAENTVYTLRLAKGFAKDTSGADVMPSRYVFRTREDDDYGKIQVHLPGKYLLKPKDADNPKFQYLLRVMADNDSVYQQPVTDTMINLSRLKPAKYTFRIIVDKNGNGKWDTGNLFGKVQPEEVIPYTEQLTLKAGWDNRIDFEQKPVPKDALKDKKDKSKEPPKDKINK